MRTIAILRICGLLGCEYEWGGQAAFWGPITGVSDDECDVLAVGDADDPRWTESERALIRAVDEQRMELLVAVGWYRTICTLCNGLALPTEGWMRRWPASAD